MKSSNEEAPVFEKWLCAESKAVLLLVHGLGGYSGRWQFLAQYMVKNGVSSYALDLKGFGNTKTLKGHIDSFEEYNEDILRLCEIIRRENSGKKIFLLGESMGALIAYLLTARLESEFSGLICVSPAFKSKVKFSYFEYCSIFLSLIFNPRKKFKIDFDSAMITRDSDYIKVMDLDQRERRTATAGLLFEILISQFKAAFFKYKINIPILFLLAGDDMLVDSKVSARIFEKIKNDDKQIIEYAGMYHALTIDMDRERVFADIIAWIGKNIG